MAFKMKGHELPGPNQRTSKVFSNIKGKTKKLVTKTKEAIQNPVAHLEKVLKGTSILAGKALNPAQAALIDITHYKKTGKVPKLSDYGDKSIGSGKTWRVGPRGLKSKVKKSDFSPAKQFAGSDKKTVLSKEEKKRSDKSQKIKDWDKGSKKTIEHLKKRVKVLEALKPLKVSRPTSKSLLDKGFLPTPMADSIAKAKGGVQAFKKKKSEAKQRSSKPDKIKKMQTSKAAKLIKGWENLTEKHKYNPR